MRNIYAYIRVSTRDQNEDRQLIALQELQIPIFYLMRKSHGYKPVIVDNQIIIHLVVPLYEKADV